MPVPSDDRVSARNDLAWAISVGAMGAIGFAALLIFTWNFAATLFLIFAGILLGVALNAMTNLLGRVVRLPHALRLTLVCLVLAGLLAGVVFLGGSTIAQQAKVLSDTIKSQLVNVKAFLEQHGIDASYFDLGNAGAATSSSASTTPGATAGRNIPGADALASSGSAIIKTRQNTIERPGSTGHHGTRNPRCRSGCVLRSTITPAETTMNANSVPIFDKSANVPISQIPAGIPTTRPAIHVLTCGVRKRV